MALAYDLKRISSAGVMAIIVLTTKSELDIIL